MSNPCNDEKAGPGKVFSAQADEGDSTFPDPLTGPCGLPLTVFDDPADKTSSILRVIGGRQAENCHAATAAIRLSGSEQQALAGQGILPGMMGL